MTGTLGLETPETSATPVPLSVFMMDIESSITTAIAMTAALMREAVRMSAAPGPRTAVRLAVESSTVTITALITALASETAVTSTAAMMTLLATKILAMTAEVWTSDC